MNERLPSKDGSSFELPPSAEDVEGLERQLEKAKEQRDDHTGSDKRITSVVVADDKTLNPAQSVAQTGDSKLLNQPAAENEVVEKIWVDRAKAAIAQHHDSPYKQKQALSRVRADYMKARFNMVLRVEEAE